MTVLVGIRCKDGVVIGSDSSATFGDGHALRTIEQPTSKKIAVVGNHVIVAGTGYVGHMQRFTTVVQKLWDDKAFQGKTDIEAGKLLSSAGLRDFDSTHTANRISFAALVALPVGNEPVLCELPGGPAMFQPEIKKVDDLWFASAGSGQAIADPFLALLRKVFWRDGAPPVEEGIFAAVWTLQHACEVNPGGINEPIHVATLSFDKGKLGARMLGEAELAEHRNIVSDATKHMASFKDIIQGKAAASVPLPQV